MIEFPMSLPQPLLAHSKIIARKIKICKLRAGSECDRGGLVPRAPDKPKKAEGASWSHSIPSLCWSSIRYPRCVDVLSGLLVSSVTESIYLHATSTKTPGLHFRELCRVIFLLYMPLEYAGNERLGLVSLNMFTSCKHSEFNIVLLFRFLTSYKSSVSATYFA